MTLLFEYPRGQLGRFLVDGLSCKFSILRLGSWGIVTPQLDHRCAGLAGVQMGKKVNYI